MEILFNKKPTDNYTTQSILDDELLTTAEVAKYLRVDRATLYRWRKADISPKYYSLNGKMVYKRSDLSRYLHQNSHTSLQYR